MSKKTKRSSKVIEVNSAAVETATAKAAKPAKFFVRAPGEKVCPIMAADLHDATAQAVKLFGCRPDDVVVTLPAENPAHKMMPPEPTRKFKPVVITHKPSDATVKVVKEKAPKVGGLFGFSATAAVRALAKAGCLYEQVKKALVDNKCSIAEVTLKIQFHAGKKGERGIPAPLTAEQIEGVKAIKVA